MQMVNTLRILTRLRVFFLRLFHLTLFQPHWVALGSLPITSVTSWRRFMALVSSFIVLVVNGTWMESLAPCMQEAELEVTY